MPVTDVAYNGTVDRILEEIETLGREEVAELRLRLKVPAQHLPEELHQPKKAS